MLPCLIAALPWRHLLVVHFPSTPTRDGGPMDAKDLMAGDPARNDLLVLVDGLDRPLGTAGKESAHREGLLHRAFSVVLTRQGEGGRELLLAQRAAGKYHSAGLWANSCCSHPRAGEDVVDAARRRVAEELGSGASGLRDICSFVYRAEFDNGIAEHECDHVVVGRCVGEVAPDPAEASEVRWVTFDALAAELANEPVKFAVWAPIALTLAMASLRREGRAGTR